MIEESVKLKRGCPAIEVPSGWPVQLEEGEEVLVTNTLGGSFTVLLHDGRLARIDGEHADALGKEREERKRKAPANLEEAVWQELETVFDPEIPVNIVELGLIYGVQLEPGLTGQQVKVRMTMTAPGCGMGDVLKSDVERKVGALKGVERVEVEIVLDPPWDPSLMSEAARLATGMW